MAGLRPRIKDCGLASFMLWRTKAVWQLKGPAAPGPGQSVQPAGTGLSRARCNVPVRPAFSPVVNR